MSLKSRNSPIVLVIDDEVSYIDGLSSGLASEGFHFIGAQSGSEGIEKAKKWLPDIILLDLTLPDMPGDKVVEKLSQDQDTRSAPIILVSARDSEVDIVLGLQIGATDYVTKPFRLKELVARIRAILRRMEHSSTLGVKESNKIRVGHIEVDFDRYEVFMSGKPLPLTPSEFELLALFVTKPGMLILRDEIMTHLWDGQDMPDPRTVDTVVRKLRDKTGDTKPPSRIITVRGIGFRFEEKYGG
ncbi:MAG: response regulator transcription factor [Acidimicrobiales bacterium]|nr:response regulator transcription factor [Acidimicrobiales bacterium]